MSAGGLTWRVSPPVHRGERRKPQRSDGKLTPNCSDATGSGAADCTKREGSAHERASIRTGHPAGCARRCPSRTGRRAVATGGSRHWQLAPGGCSGGRPRPRHAGRGRSGSACRRSGRGGQACRAPANAASTPRVVFRSQPLATAPAGPCGSFRAGKRYAPAEVVAGQERLPPRRSLSCGCHTNQGANSMSRPTQGSDPAFAYLMGECHALYLMVQVLAHAHPDPKALLSGFDAMEQSGLAHIEKLPVADQAIDGYRFVMAGVRRVVEAAAENRPSSPEAN